MLKVLTSFRDMFMIPDLRRRLFFTLLLLGMCRIGAYLPIPGIDVEALKQWLDEMTKQPLGQLFGMINLFAGGAMKRATVNALGIMPYISASIIFQLLVSVIPSLEKLAKEGEYGRKKITQYTRYATVVLCLFQAMMIVRWLESQSFGVSRIVPDPTMAFRITAVLVLTSGTVFLMWLGEQITERGIGNGISLIIMCNIVSRIPSSLYSMLLNATWRPWDAGGRIGLLKIVLLAVLFVAVVVGVVFITQGQRRIPMQQAKHARGRKVYGGQRTYLPLRVNQAGVIPIIFASSFLMLPQFAAQFGFSSLQAYMTPTSFLYNFAFIVLIFFFCYFYTAITFNPLEMADNLKQSGSFIPGTRPGRRTAEYLEKVMTRITLAGAAFLALIAILPQLISSSMGVGYYLAGFMGGTGILIVVGVALDLVQKIESHLLLRHYEGFVRGARMKGRLR